MCISKILRGILLIQQEIYDTFDIYLCHTSVNIAACSLQRQNTYLPIYFVLRTRTKGVFTCSIPTSIVTINTRKYCACTCRWTHFSSIGSILVSITTILTSIVIILASIEQVNTPLLSSPTHFSLSNQKVRNTQFQEQNFSITNLLKTVEKHWQCLP